MAQGGGVPAFNPNHQVLGWRIHGAAPMTRWMPNWRATCIALSNCTVGLPVSSACKNLTLTPHVGAATAKVRRACNTPLANGGTQVCRRANGCKESHYVSPFGEYFHVAQENIKNIPDRRILMLFYSKSTK
ncbi:hypothetical protein LP414_16200 [Polaromonas sp. P1(28)-13]|nr:hypothetical protein LP414_16200 [Polaromonas sp. P1(28)-13]